MAKENCVGGLKLETNYKVCVNATYRDLGDMQQQDCNFTTTLSQLDLMNNGVQCILFDTNSTTPTTTPQRSRMYTFSSFSSLGTRPSHAGEEGGCLRVWFWLYIASHTFSYLLTLHVTSLLPRLPHPPGFDLLQCAKTPIEGVVHCITWLTLMSGWQALPDGEKNDL